MSLEERAVMSAEDIRRTLARMAHEVIEHNPRLEDLVLVGIPTRGVPLAVRLSANIAKFETVQIPVGSLDFTFYRDDLSYLEIGPSVRRTDIPVSIDGRSVVLVDDVLYTGRSVRAAMDALIDMGRPRSIQLAVLIDRGHRELPIRADYVGKNIPSSMEEEIRVLLEEVDGRDEVVISRIAGAPHDEK